MADIKGFIGLFEGTDQLISDLAKRAERLAGEDRVLFNKAIEQVQIVLAELQATGEELTAQAAELAEVHKVADEERRRYLGLFAFAPDAYIVTDPYGVVVEADERAGALFGVKPALLVKKSLVAFVDRKDKKAFFAQMGRFLDSEGLENWEIYFRTRKGKPFPAQVEITAILDRTGNVSGLRWLIRDATEAKKREEIARLATFPELNPEPVVEVDTAGHVYYLNRAAKRLLRALPQEGLDHPWLAGLSDLAERLWKSGRTSMSREVRIDNRWFLQQVWSPSRGGRLRIYGRDITARRAAEDKLRASEQAYRDLVDNANSIIIRWKPSGEITYLNRFAQSFFGYAEKEILGRSVRILVPETDSQGLDLSHLVDEIAALPEFHASAENENVLRDGRRAWVQWTNKALRDEQGNLMEILAIGNDITRRKRAEDTLLAYQDSLEEQVRDRTADLLRSSELLERMFASVDLAIAFLDTDFNFLRVNRAFADSFGSPPESYVGKNLFALYPDERALGLFRRVLETGQPHVEFESPFLQAGTGAERTFWDWSLQRVAAGDVVEGVVLTLVDVTTRIKAEEEGRRLATAVEQSAEAVVITDRDDRILYANRTFESLHGRARTEVFGRKYGDLLGFGAEDDAFRSGLRETLDRGETWKGRLTRTLDGRQDRKLDVTISPVRDPAGQIVNYAVLEHDATREHRLEVSIRNLQKLDALGALAGGIAHDFNNILVPVFINAELAAFEVEKDGPASRNLKLILEAANRGRGLVRQIIAFSRPTEQRRDVIDITPILKETLEFLRSSLPRSIAIVERFDAGTGRVRADPTQITQVLMNLGTNAAYAMRETGGRLSVGLSDVVLGPEPATVSPELVPGPYVKLTVEDDGSGMPPEVLERIFEPFFTTKRRGEGTGMGLAVVRGIVKSHGGTVTVSSVPGRGTTFEVYFPAAKGRVKPAPAPSAEGLMGKGRILFVDDEDMLVRSVKPMLERLGFSVTATTDPLEALALFRRRPAHFDLVITDETMPGLTGDKLAQELLRIRPDVPIILSTGFSESVREEDLPALGIREFIMKPFSTSEIAEKIRSALKKA